MKLITGKEWLILIGNILAVCLVILFGWTNGAFGGTVNDYPIFEEISKKAQSMDNGCLTLGAINEKNRVIATITVSSEACKQGSCQFVIRMYLPDKKTYYQICIMEKLVISTTHSVAEVYPDSQYGFVFDFRLVDKEVEPLSTFMEVPSIIDMLKAFLTDGRDAATVAKEFAGRYLFKEKEGF